MAPNLHKDDPVYSKGVDIWSLGVLLYELMTLETPFKSPDSIMNKEYKPVETTDFKRASDLVEILDACL